MPPNGGPWLSAAPVLALALVWALSPLARHHEFATTLDIIQHWGDHPGAILLVIGVYLLAGLALFPLSLLNLAAGVLFGPFWGLLLLLSAVVVLLVAGATKAWVGARPQWRSAG